MSNDKLPEVEAMEVISRADSKKARDDSNSGNDCQGVDNAGHFFGKRCAIKTNNGLQNFYV